MSRSWERRLGELDLRISPEAFFQTNTEMAERLYAIAVSYAALEGWERVYDLYWGSARSRSRSPRTRERSGGSSSSSRRSPMRSQGPSAMRSPTQSSSPATRAWRCRSSSSASGARMSSSSIPAGGPIRESRPAHHRSLAQADRLHLLQPDDAGAERRRTHAGGLDPEEGPTRGHVPPNTSHRVCGSARAGRVLAIVAQLSARHRTSVRRGAERSSYAHARTKHPGHHPHRPHGSGPLAIAHRIRIARLRFRGRAHGACERGRPR